MRVSLNWLNDYISIKNIAPKDLAATLTDLGLEVEAIEPINNITGTVVVGEVLEAEKHPDADSLKVCKVNIGEGDPLEIVCGAPNARAGIKACVATVGSVLPGNLKMKASKIRGVKSFGMLLAEDELGLSGEHDGIIELDKHIPIGTAITDLYPLNDTVLELGLTPNRADCLGYLGIARDLSAKLGIPVKMPKLGTSGRTPDVSSEASVKISVASDDDCPRFSAVYIKDLSTTASPAWVSKRLEAAGMRPINLIVDVTNYVMLEYGQPIHAYDERDVSGNHIQVRGAKSGEELKTLDGNTHKLTAEDIVIADDSGAIGLAGVMGGENSEVKEDTNTIIVEVAGFDPRKIRRTSKRLGLHTEASHRFERGTSLDVTADVCRRVGFLLYSLSQELGLETLPRVADDLIDFYPKPAVKAKIALRPSRVRKIIGMSSLTEDQMVTALESLQFSLLDRATDRLLLEVPLWRQDVMREIDLVEEVGRIVGFDQVPYSLPQMEIGPLRENPFIAFIEKNRRSMALCGFSETISFPFVGSADLSKLQLADEHLFRQAVALANPLTEDINLMQSTLIPNLLKACENNRRHGVNGSRLFEIGRGYLAAKKDSIKDGYLSSLTQPGKHNNPKAAAEDNRRLESNLLAGIIDQPFSEKTWEKAETTASFFHGKWAVLSWLKGFGQTDLTFTSIDPAELPFLHPGSAAVVSSGTHSFGYVGQVHPKTARAYGFDSTLAPIVFEFSLDRFMDVCTQRPSFDTEARRFPPVARDLAFVVDETVSHQNFVDTLAKFQRKRNLRDTQLFDLYRGENVGDGKKSMAYAFSFQSVKRTLNDKEVEKEVAELVKYIEAELGASLR